MSDNTVSDVSVLAEIRRAQANEETGALMYTYMAKREKNPENKRIFEQMARDETAHANLWKSVTGESIKPHQLKIVWLKIITIIFGFTFVVKTLDRTEKIGAEAYAKMLTAVPEAGQVLLEERHHEEELEAMLDEERLHYVGSMVLGLNDALVELTGAIAGVTFALANTRLVALTGLITGISATLSMAASNYLAERASGNENALKSSAYTGAAYLITVALLVLPYILLPEDMYGAAFAVMIAVVLLIILFFNYYISVAKSEPFFRRFGEMAAISLSVAVISFVIGILAKMLLGIDAM
ncbi:MAG: VIT1/CCC1 transporter family protein [Methanocorpusculum sp.]|nr:VIT1/CCC1 transporter family protein [Methanocorpusculum sp.]